jgi:uncharacterized protein (DUF697 family)
MKDLQEMDKQADSLIAGWSFGALAANLLPPPFDAIAVGAAFTEMGRRLGKVYGVKTSWKTRLSLGRSMAKGVSTAAAAAYIGSGLFKYVPGVNLWVALLIQPPIVAAVAYSAGHAFKQYFHAQISGGSDFSPEEVQRLTEMALRQRLAT